MQNLMKGLIYSICFRFVQGLHWQMWKSNALYLWKYYTQITEIFVSTLSQLDIYYH